MTALKRSSGDGVDLTWAKSSYSDNDGPECVEVAATADAIHVRDSKHPTGPRLTFDAHTWTTFVANRPCN